MKPLKMSKFCQSVPIILGITLLFVGLFFRLVGSAAQQPAGGEYRVPVASEPTTLDPSRISDVYSTQVVVNLFDGLVEFDKDLNIIPAIAKRWIISRDHRIYTFYLRKGVKFHNGREVTADDFVYSFRRILEPMQKSPGAFLFNYVSGVKAFREGKSQTVLGLRTKDRYTLSIELEEPFAPFLSILASANAKVVPKEAVGSDFETHPIGTGPFRFHSWEKGHAILLTANKDYFGGHPKVNTVRFRIYTNDQWELIFNDFEKGLLDQAIVPRSKYSQVTAESNYKDKYRLLTTPGLNIVYVGMNGTVPPFNDHRIRQAVSYAVDTHTIVKQITGMGSVPAKGILPPGLAGHNPNLKGYPYDPRKARELLTEAGYPDGKGIPPIEIWTVSKSQRVKNELVAYQKYLAEVGVQLIPKVAENWKEFVGRINNKQAQMFYAAWYADFPDPDNFLYVLTHSKSPTNRMGYRNPEVDKLLEQARHETDYMERIQIYRKVDALVMKEAPLICQHTNSYNFLLQPWVKDVDMGYLGPAHIRLRNVRLARK